MHKPHNRISHWLNVLWKKTAQLNHVYPSVFPLHTQSHSSWCSKGTSVNDLCNPRTPTLGFSWRTWRRRSQASGKQQVLHHTPRLWDRLHWKPTRSILKLNFFNNPTHPLLFLLLPQATYKIDQIMLNMIRSCCFTKSFEVSDFHLILFKNKQ